MVFPEKYHSMVGLNLMSENIGANGKVQRIYNNGKKEIMFNNGVRREVRVGLKRRSSQMGIQWYTSIIRISNRPTRMARWFISSQKLERLKRHTRIIYKSLSFRMDRLRSTSQMARKKSSERWDWNLASQMGLLSVYFQTERKRVSSRMARSSELRNQGLSR